MAMASLKIDKKKETGTHKKLDQKWGLKPVKSPSNKLDQRSIIQRRVQSIILQALLSCPLSHAAWNGCSVVKQR